MAILVGRTMSRKREMKSLYMESLITGKFRENLPLDVLQDLYTYAAMVREEINREIQRRESKEKATSSKN